MLKPCPFCGGAVSMTYNSGEKAFAIWHKDKSCGFIEPFWIDQEYAKSLREAEMLWNRRTEGVILTYVRQD